MLGIKRGWNKQLPKVVTAQGFLPRTSNFSFVHVLTIKTESELSSINEADWLRVGSGAAILGRNSVYEFNRDLLTAHHAQALC